MCVHASTFAHGVHLFLSGGDALLEILLELGGGVSIVQSIIPEALSGGHVLSAVLTDPISELLGTIHGGGVCASQNVGGSARGLRKMINI